MKIMKKLTILTLLMLSMGIVLTGCTTNNDSAEDVDTDVVVKEDVQEQVADRNEYQFEFTVKWADGFEMSSKVYKKGNNSMTEFLKMVWADDEEMPFVPVKMLTVDGKTYEQVEKDGKTFWFSIPGVNAEDEMFNLREMSMIDKSMVIDTKKEKINGKKMTCYYTNDAEVWEGKWCLYKGVFAYGEYMEDGVLDTIEITNYDDSVKSSIFKAPAEDDVLSTQDMMQLFQ